MADLESEKVGGRPSAQPAPWQQWAARGHNPGPLMLQELFSKQKGYLDEELDFRKQALDQAHKVRDVEPGTSARAGVWKWGKRVPCQLAGPGPMLTRTGRRWTAAPLSPFPRHRL